MEKLWDVLAWNNYGIILRRACVGSRGDYADIITNENSDFMWFYVSHNTYIDMCTHSFHAIGMEEKVVTMLFMCFELEIFVDLCISLS